MLWAVHLFSAVSEYVTAITTQNRDQRPFADAVVHFKMVHFLREKLMVPKSYFFVIKVTRIQFYHIHQMIKYIENILPTSVSIEKRPTTNVDKW